MALPPLDTSAPLDDSEPAPNDPNEGGFEDSDSGSSEVDPMFAADMDETGLDLDDKQMASLQRAILGLMGSSGGGSLPPMGAPPAPGAPATPFG